MTAVTTVPTTNVSTTIAAAASDRMRMGVGINNNATDSSSNKFCQVCHPQYRNRITAATTTTATTGTNLKRCQQCRLVYYCSQQCQRIDWKYHRTICTVRHKNNCNNVENGDVPSTSSSPPPPPAAAATAAHVVIHVPPRGLLQNLSLPQWITTAMIQNPKVIVLTLLPRVLM
jgi:MYND finger